MEPLRILCEFCRDKPKSEGCTYCGGFRFLLERSQCPGCGVVIWDRSLRGTTLYEGKRLTSWNGVTMVYHLDREARCTKCEGAKDE